MDLNSFLARNGVVSSSKKDNEKNEENILKYIASKDNEKEIKSLMRRHKAKSSSFVSLVFSQDESERIRKKRKKKTNDQSRQRNRV